MFGDYPIPDKSTQEDMLLFLSGIQPANAALGYGVNRPCDLEAGQRSPSGSFTTQPRNSDSTTGKFLASSSTGGSTYVDSGEDSRLSTLEAGSLWGGRYLEICVNVGKHETKLAEIQVTPPASTTSTICTDGHLFTKIHDRYFETRRQRKLGFLFKPVNIRFIQFSVQQNHHVGFFDPDVDPLPPETELVEKRWEYYLNPNVPPPIDARTFLHYFWKHRDHAESTRKCYVERLPKKLGHSLLSEFDLDELRRGWGIHIIEGLNKPLISWTIFVIILLSLAVSLAYNRVAKTTDSGFSIGQWMIAAFSVALSAAYFTLEDEANLV
jgi:hypothetical protein